MATNSIERTESQSSSSAQALGGRSSVTLDVSRSRKKSAPAGSGGPEFRSRNLGLSGEKPPNMDVARGHYLDILI